MMPPQQQTTAPNVLQCNVLTHSRHTPALSRTGQIDEQLAAVFFDSLQTCFMCVGAVVVICITIPWMILFVPPTLLYLLYIRRFVTASTRELKRFESISRSPIIETTTATMNGLTTIRAFGREDVQHRWLVSFAEENAQAWYWWLLGNRYIGFRLDMLTVNLVGGASGLAVLLTVLKEQGKVKVAVDAGMIGLAIVYVIGLSGMLQFMVRQSALVETYMTSAKSWKQAGAM